MKQTVRYAYNEFASSCYLYFICLLYVLYFALENFHSFCLLGKMFTHQLSLPSILQLVMLVWCYFMVVFCDPGSVPENWKLVVEQGNSEEGSSMPLTDCVAPENLASALSSSDGMERIHGVRYCRQCENGKPPRCHHCSVCKLSLQAAFFSFFFWCVYVWVTENLIEDDLQLALMLRMR